MDHRTNTPIKPSDIHLDNLSYLSLNSNQLSSVPSILKFVPTLKQLHLHMNKLTDLRELCRSQFRGLEVLDVGNNRINEVPIALVYYLASLTMLAVNNNDAKSIPNWLGSH